jgi:hypothetical protein
MNFLAIGEVVQVIDPIDEDYAGLRVLVGGPHDAFPQIAGPDRSIDAASEHEIPGPILAHRPDKGIGDEHGNIEVPEPRRVRLGGNELLDVWMIAPERPHHGAAPRSSRHDGSAHGIPDIHETDRTRGIRSDARYGRPSGSQRREVVPDAAALLHRQRRFFHVLEDGAKIIVDAAHHKAVEERHLPIGAGPGDDAPRRQEAEVGERRKIAFRPALARALAAPLDPRGRPCHPPPSVVDRTVDWLAVRCLEPVFRIPDLFRDGAELEGGHQHRYG